MKDKSKINSGQHYQETLATLGLYALEQDNIETIMHRAIQQSCALLNLKCTAVFLLNESRDNLKIVSESGCDCTDIDIENNVKWDIGYALSSKKPVTIFDYRDENRFQISPCMAERDFISSIQIAIRGVEEIYGVFSVYSKEKREFTEQDLHFIQVVANILGRSLEQKNFKKELLDANKRLRQEMERTRQIKKEIINQDVLQRWELGGYLHDNFGQLLASIKILVDDIQLKVARSDTDVTPETNEINNIIDSCIADIHDVIHDIIPVDVEQEGVAQAFRIVMTHTFKMHGVRCILESDEILDEIKNREAATHLYHILQESVKNAATHGKADLIVISPKKVSETFILQIKDNGIGLEATKNGNGKGIRIMKHRMDLLGGSLKIEDYSDDNQSGTVVTCMMPLANLKKNEEDK